MATKGKGGAGGSTGAGPTAGATEDEDLPVIESLGMVQVPQGWCVVVIHTQGLKVVDKDILGEPGSRAVALERLKLETVRRYVRPPQKGGATA